MDDCFARVPITGFLVKCGSYCKFWGITVDFENVGTTAMQTWGIAVN